MLIPRLKNPCIQAVCEYSEATEMAEWTIRYNGAQLDVTSASDQNLSLAVLKGMTEEITYTWLETDQLPNQLKLTLRSK